MREFKETYKLFKSALDSATDADYTEARGWLQLSNELKAPALYIAFYSEIVLAWNKIHDMYPWVDECTAVSTLLQYLMKNVNIIKAHPQRFKPQYIYTVTYKCMYSLGQLKDARRWYQNRVCELEMVHECEPLIDDIRDNLSNKPHYTNRLIDVRSVEDQVEAKEVWQTVELMIKADPSYEDARDVLLGCRLPRNGCERKRIEHAIFTLKILFE